VSATLRGLWRKDLTQQRASTHLWLKLNQALKRSEGIERRIPANCAGNAAGNRATFCGSRRALKGGSAATGALRLPWSDGVELIYGVCRLEPPCGDEPFSAPFDLTARRLDCCQLAGTDLPLGRAFGVIGGGQHKPCVRLTLQVQ
jgi:hypothetical protein